jgi:hypothetical protein
MYPKNSARSRLPFYQDWLVLARWADASENASLRVSCDMFQYRINFNTCMSVCGRRSAREQARERERERERKRERERERERVRVRKNDL